MELVLYSKTGCCLCVEMAEQVERVLPMLGGPVPMLTIRDITENAAWTDDYRHRIPVLKAGRAVVAEGRVTDAELVARLAAVRKAAHGG